MITGTQPAQVSKLEGLPLFERQPRRHGEYVIPPSPADICAAYHKGNPESKAANRRVDKQDQSKRILAALAAHERATQDGLMCEELEELLGLTHQSCSARISELRKDGRIIKAGIGTTRSGCNAGVYKLA